MPPYMKPRERLQKERFPGYFGGFKPQAYQDPVTARNLSFSIPQSTDKAETSVVGVRTISWNPLSSLVATGSSDRSVRVWNPEKPSIRMSTELKGHTAAIARVAFNPAKDAELCSLGVDGVLRVWDVRTKACVNEVRDLGDATVLAWTPDGDSLVVGSRTSKKEDTLFVIGRTMTTPHMSATQTARINDVAFCWGGRKMFVAMADGGVRILSLATLLPVLRQNYVSAGGEEEEFVLRGHSSECLSLALSPTGCTLATGGLEAVIALWDTTKWVCTRTITSMSGPVRSLSFSWDGNYIVGGSTEGTAEIDVTQAESGELVHTFKTVQVSPVVAWAPTRYFMAYTDQGSLRIVGVDPDRKY